MEIEEYKYLGVLKNKEISIFEKQLNVLVP